ncbi:MAG: PQQ-binding-like beta-propeller repeat protein [Verrucomicrobiota bacterium]
MIQRNWIFGLVAIIIALMCAVTNAVAETELIGTQTVWRVWTVQGPYVGREQDKKLFVIEKDAHREYTPQTARLTDLPPTGWTESSVDDQKWIRKTGQELSDQLGGFGLWNVWFQPARSLHPASLFLRTRFSVSDPAKATDLKFSLEYLGGAIVYVNGIEVGRGDMPGGALDAYAVANDYPIEAYVTDDGKTLLPSQLGEYGIIRLDPKWSNRYQARVRTITVDVPAKVLVKGANVLTVDLRRAPVCGPLPVWRAWGHVGFRAAGMTSASGAGVVDPLKSTRIWGAWETEQFMAQSAKQPPAAEATTPAVNTRAVTSKYSGPFDPVDPVRIMVSRKGIGHGVVVLACPDGLRDVRATERDFKGSDGTTLPAGVSRIKFAAQDQDVSSCGTLLEKAPEGKKTLPVWLEVNVTKEQVSCWYKSELSLEANGETFIVPIEAIFEKDAVQNTDWTGFLGGPLRTANAGAEDLLKSWPDEGPRLLWSAKGLGGGYPEVLVVGNAVFTLGCIGRNGNLQCLDRLTGQVRWRQAVPGIGASTPAWADDRLFLLAGSTLLCYNAKTGAPIWGKDVNRVLKDAGITFKPMTSAAYNDGSVQSPLVYHDMVIMITGQQQGVAVALDTLTGALRWVSKGSTDANSQSWNSASVIRCGNRDLILAPCLYDLVAIQPEDGKVAWEVQSFPRHPAGNGYTYTWACSPVYSEGFLHLFAGYVTPQWSTYRLPGDGSTIEKAWNRRRLDPRQENVVLIDGVMYARGFVTWSDIENNAAFRYDGKTLDEQAPEVANRWRARGKNNPDNVILEAVLVGQELKTGKVIGAVSIPGLGGHGGALITGGDHHLYTVCSSGGGQPDAIRMVETTPVMKVVGTLRPPFAELLKAENMNGSSGGGYGGLYNRPQVAHGCLWVRVQDQLLVYDLRQ